jgi:hypothetical protein
MYSIETDSESARESTSMHPLWQECATRLSVSLLDPMTAQILLPLRARRGWDY